MSDHRPVRDAIDELLRSPDTGAPAHGPHVRDVIDLKRTMAMVVLALSPCILFAFSRYGVAAMLPLFVVSYGVGLGVEWIFALVRRTNINEGYFVTGALIPLIVPVTIPLWQLAIAVAFAVVFAKEVFGGTGYNVFNPALVCRAFLFFAYPAQMTGTVWEPPPPASAVAAVETPEQTLPAPTSPPQAESAATPWTGDTKTQAESAATPWTGDTKTQAESAATPWTGDTKTQAESAATPWTGDTKTQAESAATPWTGDTKTQAESAATPWTGDTKTQAESGEGKQAQTADATSSLDSLSTASPSVAVDALSGATALALANAAPPGQSRQVLDEAGYTRSALVFGDIPGSPGERNKLAILAGALLLLLTGIASARVMLAGILGLLVTAAAANFLTAAPAGLVALAPWDHLIMGGFLFGIVFMATDPVTHPETNAGKYFFGFMCGALTVMIRLYNPAYVEGTMLAILLMNAFSPAVDRGVLALHMRQRRSRRGL